jgi:hypothetical protein
MVNRAIHCPPYAVPDQGYLQTGSHSCGHSSDYERSRLACAVPVPIGYVVVLPLFQSLSRCVCTLKLLLQNEEQAKLDNGECLQGVAFFASRQSVTGTAAPK